jgi:hypothetical protein
MLPTAAAACAARRAHAPSAPRAQLTAPQGPGAGSPELMEELIELLRADRESAKDAARAFRSALDGWDNQALMFTMKARTAPARAAGHAARAARGRAALQCARRRRLCCLGTAAPAPLTLRRAARAAPGAGVVHPRRRRRLPRLLGDQGRAQGARRRLRSRCSAPRRAAVAGGLLCLIPRLTAVCAPSRRRR